MRRKLTPPPTDLPDECSGCGKAPENRLVGHTVAQAGTPYGDHLNLKDGEWAVLCGSCMDRWEDEPSPIPRNALDAYSGP